ncbi:MAG: hypothetical protein ACKOD9_09485, partial [Rubrivivax sp.]
MNTPSKLALSLIGQNRPRPLSATPENLRPLPPARQVGGLPLMQALAGRRSERAFSLEPLNDGTANQTLTGPWTADPA